MIVLFSFVNLFLLEFRLSQASRNSSEEKDGNSNSSLDSSLSGMPSSASSPTLNSTSLNSLDAQTPSTPPRQSRRPGSLIHRSRKKSIDSTNSDTTSLDKTENEILRSQVNEVDIVNDMTQARISTQESRSDTPEKDKKSNDKDVPTPTTTKKKFRKQEENLHRILNAPDCLDEAAITLNFILRRLFCDIFVEPLFKDLLKEKLELKLKELAVSNSIEILLYLIFDI